MRILQILVTCLTSLQLTFGQSPTSLEKENPMTMGLDEKLLPYVNGNPYKADPRNQIEKENPMDFHNPEETSMQDVLEGFEALGLYINKFELGKFDKNYSIVLTSDEYEDGKLIGIDTLAQFSSTYVYFDSQKPYYDFLDKIKIITKVNGNKSDFHLKTYAMSTKNVIELNRKNKNSTFHWRTYKETSWKLNKKVPLMVFASSWRDEAYGFERFCGVMHLTENGKYTNELLSFSPAYAIISYRVTPDSN